jgi:hypothetical protein
MNKCDRKIEVTRKTVRNLKSRPGEPVDSLHRRALVPGRQNEPHVMGVWAHQGCAGSSSSHQPKLVASGMHDHLPAELGGCRKAVLATDVGETAVLVPGITHVVYPGVRSEEPFQMISKQPARRR